MRRPHTRTMGLAAALLLVAHFAPSPLAQHPVWLGALTLLGLALVMRVVEEDE